MPAKKNTTKVAAAKSTPKKSAPTKKAPAKTTPAKKSPTTKTPKKAPSIKGTTPEKAKPEVTIKRVKKSKSYAEAESKAQQYAKDPKKLKKLVDKATEYSKKAPKGPFGESWAYLMAMIRLIQAYYKGTYRKIPFGSLITILIAVIYVINPLDLIPDPLPFIGQLDDAIVVGIALAQVRADLDVFMAWELETVAG